MKKNGRSMENTEDYKPKLRPALFKLAIFVICSASYMQKAYSDCSTTSTVTGQTFSLEGGIPVSPNASVGGVIYTKTVTFTSDITKPYITCPEYESKLRYWYYNNLSAGLYTPEILKTSVAGLGVRIKGPDGRYITSPPQSVPLSSGPISLTYAGENTLTIEFIKMSPTLGAFKLRALLISNIGYYIVAGSKDYQGWNIAWNGELTSSAATCSTSNVYVPLGKHPSSLFGDVGDKSPPSQFEVKVTCASPTPNVGIRLDPVFTKVGTGEGILSLDPSSNVEGIGVQIMTRNGDAVKFGLPIKNDNSAVAQTSFSFPFQAAFIKTGSVVSSGIVKSSATVTITYQ